MVRLFVFCQFRWGSRKRSVCQQRRPFRVAHAKSCMADQFRWKQEPVYILCIQGKSVVTASPPTITQAVSPCAIIAIVPADVCPFVILVLQRGGSISVVAQEITLSVGSFLSFCSEEHDRDSKMFTASCQGAHVCGGYLRTWETSKKGTVSASKCSKHILRIHKFFPGNKRNENSGNKNKGKRMGFFVMPTRTTASEKGKKRPWAHVVPDNCLESCFPVVLLSLGAFLWQPLKGFECINEEMYNWNFRNYYGDDGDRTLSIHCNDQLQENNVAGSVISRQDITCIEWICQDKQVLLRSCANSSWRQEMLGQYQAVIRKTDTVTAHCIEYLVSISRCLRILLSDVVPCAQKVQV